MKISRSSTIKMVNILFLVSISVGVSLASVACQFAAVAEPVPLPALEPTPGREQQIILGDVSQDPAETIKDFQPMADYLAVNLTELGIQRGSVVVAPNLETMIDYIKTGQVDIYFDSPYPALTVYEEAGAIPLLRRWKDGVEEYGALIVARSGGSVTKLADLPGHIIAFEDEGSTSGYLLPKAYLVKAGFELIEQTDGKKVDNDKIGYVFVGSEENILAWVLEGKTDAGSVNSADFASLSAEQKNQLIVLGQTQNVPRHIVLVSSTTDEPVRQRVAELLADMDKTEEGRALLESFEETSQFDPLPEGGEKMMKSLQQLFLPVR